MIKKYFNAFSANRRTRRYQRDTLKAMQMLWSEVKIPEVGYGNDPHSKTIEMHWPTAYSLFLTTLTTKASIKHLKQQNAHIDTNILTNHIVKWLLKHQRCESTELPVWTLPYQRKIWLDVLPCKQNTGFNVPTVHGIHAMCDISDIKDETREMCIKSALIAATSWDKNCSTVINGEKIYWYSTLRNHSFHVTNAISLMAGAIQRASHYSKQVNLNAEISTDQAILYLLNCKRSDIELPTWDYFGREYPSNKNNRNNDLLHEAFVCDGLFNYKKFGGNLGSSINYNDLILMLLKFCRNDKIYDFPISEENAKRKQNPARGIGLAHALYIICEIHRESKCQMSLDLAHKLFAEIKKKIICNGKILLRENGDSISSFIRTRAHIILAISKYYDLASSLKRVIN